jgi:hypothetical protein
VTLVVVDLIVGGPRGPVMTESRDLAGWLARRQDHHPRGIVVVAGSTGGKRGRSTRRP